MPLAPAAVGIVFDTLHTHILLVKRCDVPVWVLPGGGIDLDESPLQAVVREIFEETGLNVNVERQAAEYTPINRLAALTFVFICKIKDGEIQTSSESSEVRFFAINQLPSNLFTPHLDWIHDALSSTGLVKKPLTQITYLAALKYFLKHPIHILSYAWTRWIKKHLNH